MVNLKTPAGATDTAVSAACESAGPAWGAALSKGAKVSRLAVLVVDEGKPQRKFRIDHRSATVGFVQVFIFILLVKPRGGWPR